MTVRILVDDFALANPYYAGATIHIYELDGDLLPTETLANLYAGTTGSELLENPQVLDSEGKFEQPVYVGDPVSTTVTRPDDEGAETETGTQGLVARWRGVWATATVYYPGERVQHPTTGLPYTVLTGHTSAGSIATDISASRLELEADLSGYAPLVSPALAGSPTAPTPATADSSAAIATTAHVHAVAAEVAAAAAAALAARSDTYSIALSDETTALTTGDGKSYWSMAFTINPLTEVMLSLGSDASSSGAVTVDIEYWNGSAWASIFSTLPTIDANEFDTLTAATPAVLSVTNLPKGTRMRGNIDGAGTGAKGLKAYFNGNRA